MAIVELMNLLGFGAAIGAVAVSVGQLIGKLIAERRLRERIARDLDFHRLVLMRSEVLRGLEQEPPDPKYLLLVRAMIEAELDELTDRDRVRIMTALRQPSRRSQADYAARLLRDSAPSPSDLAGV